MSKKHEVMIIANYPQTPLLSLSELCEICKIASEKVEELIAYEIIHPKYSSQHQMLFDLTDLQRVKTTIRLQRDLEVNLAGVTLILDLLNEIEELRARNQFLERYF
jgi:chaperone modulatory protein CbpM